MRTIIIGAGQAAGQAAATLRQKKYEGEIVIIGDEPHPPYQRPPLSKEYLSGAQGLDRMFLRPEKFYQDQHIELRTRTRVVQIDPKSNCVETNAGDTLEYTSLLLTTGGRPRKLDVPGKDLNGIHYLRRLSDVDRIREGMLEGRKLVIVGGGYIGLEVASVAVSAGLEVHVLEMEERVLQRVTTPEMSTYYHKMHSERGVNIHTATAVTGFNGDESLSSVQCGDKALDADMVIIGIGILPNVELAQAAGIACDNGIVVNEHCRTSVENIFAAGDCTQHPNPILGRRLRLESVPNAMEQARVAASNIVGEEREYAAMPWFWSDQYEHKLQMIGFSADGEQREMFGDMAQHKFAICYFKDGMLVAVDAVNSQKEFMLCRKLVGQEVSAQSLRETFEAEK